MPAPSTSPIAIVGMSCRLPGGSTSLQNYWRHLLSQNCIPSQVPEWRWTPEYLKEILSPNDIPHSNGHFIDIDHFDSEFFEIPASEALLIDPQARVLLECTWEALENSGHRPSDLRQPRPRSGVFIGCFSEDFSILVRDKGLQKSPQSASKFIGNALGLNGPNHTINTLCSSSLVAVNIACQSLRIGETDIAIAGGAHGILTPNWLLFMHKNRMLSPDAKCKSFDESGDGFGIGEGVGVIILKRLEDATSAGDNILGLILSEIIGSDGNTVQTGISVPKASSQEEALTKLIANAGLSINDIDYVEAQGSGCLFGDLTELKSLANVFQQRESPSPVAVGSVKGNIGHVFAAGGVAGIIKTLMCMQNNIIPPLVHLKQLNSLATGENGMNKLHFPMETLEWGPKGNKRNSIVSSFGLGGTNAFVVIQEPPAKLLELTSTMSHFAFVLSAKTQSALQRMAEEYTDYLKNNKLPLEGVVYTAWIGREHHAYKLGIIVTCLEELVKKLESREYETNITACVECLPNVIVNLIIGSENQALIRSYGHELYKIEYFRASFDALAGRVNQVCGLVVSAFSLGQDEEDNEIVTFCVLSSIVKMWEHVGVPVGKVQGRGRVAEIVSNRLDVEEALAQLTTREEKAGTVVDESCAQMNVSTEIELRVVAEGENVWENMSNNLIHLYMAGIIVKYNCLGKHTKVPLPSYPFERKSIWFSTLTV